MSSEHPTGAAGNRDEAPRRDAIDSRHLDLSFLHQVAAEEGGEGILHCFACGSCTVRCPEQKVKPEFNAREVIRKVILGLKEEVFASEFIWVCSAHFLCLSRCPQEVNIKAVMDAVRSCRVERETRTGERAAAAAEEPDPDFKLEVHGRSGGEDMNHCFACGACTANCPERTLDAEWSPRRVIRSVLMGLREDVYHNEFVDICAAHHRCLNECPQGVEIPKVMTALRRLAEAEGWTREGVCRPAPVVDEKEEKKKRKRGEVPRVFLP